MAEQLANLEGDLDGTKTQGLTLIYNKFKRNIQHSQQCKSGESGGLGDLRGKPD